MNEGFLTMESVMNEIITDSDSSPHQGDGPPDGESETLRTSLLLRRSVPGSETEVLLSRQVRPFLDYTDGYVEDEAIHLMRYTALLKDGCIDAPHRVGKTEYTGNESEVRFLAPDLAGFTGAKCSQHKHQPKEMFTPWLEHAKPVKEIVPEFYIRVDPSDVNRRLGGWLDAVETNDLWQMIDLSQKRHGWRHTFGREDRSPVGWFKRMRGLEPLAAVGQALLGSKSKWTREKVEAIASAVRKAVGSQSVYIGSPTIRPVDPEIRHNRFLRRSHYRDLIERPVRLNRALREGRHDDPFEIVCCDGPNDSALMDKHMGQQSIEAMREASLKM